MTPERPLQGKVALVTGASGGIGRSIALKLASQGARLGVHYNSAKARAEEIAEEIRRTDSEAMLLSADVTDSAQVQDMFSRLEDDWGGVDILVNNAGINKDSLLIRMSQPDWDDVVEVNLKGAFLCCRAAAKTMLRKRWGRIIVISSIVGMVGNVGQANYAASKAGLVGLTKSLAREIASRNITVNSLTPGFIETDMTKTMTNEMMELVISRIAMGHFGSPQDVAGFVAFLAGEEAGYITGQAFAVDGGLVL